MAAVLQWGRARAGAEILFQGPRNASRLPASMGPRPRGRGNDLGELQAALVDGWLQWGRARAGAEIRRLEHSERAD